jgi:hypothetical protein
MLTNTHGLRLEPDKEGGWDESRHHHRVGVGHSESTLLETALTYKDCWRVPTRVAERESPAFREALKRSRVGELTSG